MLSAPANFDYSHRRFIYEYYTSIYPEPPDGPTESNFNARVAYMIAACYTPNPDNPPHYVELPIDFPSGAPIPELWGKRLAHDPAVNWPERVENLRRLRGIFLEVGSRDDFALHYGHRMLSKGLTQAGIPHWSGEHDGNHAGHMYRQHQQAVGWFAETLAYDAD